MINGVVHHFHKPDCDNLAKFYMDCMNNLVYRDDSQICDLRVKKVYSMVPSTLIRIRPIVMNINKDEIDSLDELYRDEDNLRDDGQRELPRSNSDKERIVPIGGKDPDNQPV